MICRWVAEMFYPASGGALRQRGGEDPKTIGNFGHWGPEMEESHGYARLQRYRGLEGARFDAEKGLVMPEPSPAHSPRRRNSSIGLLSPVDFVQHPGSTVTLREESYVARLRAFLFGERNQRIQLPITPSIVESSTDLSPSASEILKPKKKASKWRRFFGLHAPSTTSLTSLQQDAANFYSNKNIIQPEIDRALAGYVAPSPVIRRGSPQPRPIVQPISQPRNSSVDRSAHDPSKGRDPVSPCSITTFEHANRRSSQDEPVSPLTIAGSGQWPQNSDSSGSPIYSMFKVPLYVINISASSASLAPAPQRSTAPQIPELERLSDFRTVRESFALPPRSPSLSSLVGKEERRTSALRHLVGAIGRRISCHPSPRPPTPMLPPPTPATPSKFALTARLKKLSNGAKVLTHTSPTTPQWLPPIKTPTAVVTMESDETAQEFFERTGILGNTSYCKPSFSKGVAPGQEGDMLSSAVFQGFDGAWRGSS